MRQGANQILSIQSDFLQEARSAPTLFRDLASLEQHIADSYKDRALIELLQNADDAQAGRVCVFEIGDCLVVANDGRCFTADDVKALCRSGASKKSRGGETIGFRDRWPAYVLRGPSFATQRVGSRVTASDRPPVDSSVFAAPATAPVHRYIN